jgi:hypothetical protein
MPGLAIPSHASAPTIRPKAANVSPERSGASAERSHTAVSATIDTGHIARRQQWGISRGEAVDGPAPYFQWGFIQISLANLVVIGVMLTLFALALLLPFPSHAERHDHDADPR